ncbi:hypothetical protein MATL_G00176450 [Megalops atlanticus]|uniref:Uncharacterized protein n=1 Tax=Megalops atlanticus TaxID=7932 RepID=A0A9D3SZL5_MEGAT|nr:hypothetical protein MATL_G00176450 [Megalops atlanticus]
MPGQLDSPKSASAPRKEDEAHVSEPAWTSMAREKTRGLQQLLSLTSRRSERATSVERTERAAEEESKAEPRPALETQSKSESVAPQIAMADNKCEVKSISKIPEPTSSASPVRRKYRDDRQQTKAGPFSSSTSSTGQPSWLELAKRKSLAWSDKSMD